jgi:hypothetical protein
MNSARGTHDQRRILTRDSRGAAATDYSIRRYALKESLTPDHDGVIRLGVEGQVYLARNFSQAKRKHESDSQPIEVEPEESPKAALRNKTRRLNRL